MLLSRDLRLSPITPIEPLVLHTDGVRVFMPAQPSRDCFMHIQARLNELPDDAPITFLVHGIGYALGQADQTVYGNSPRAWAKRFGHQSKSRRPQLIIHYNWNSSSRYWLAHRKISDVYERTQQQVRVFANFLSRFDDMVGARRRSILAQGLGARLALLALAMAPVNRQTRLVMVDATLRRVEVFSLLSGGKLNAVAFYNFIVPSHRRHNHRLNKVLPRSGVADDLISLGFAQTHWNWGEYILQEPLEHMTLTNGFAQTVMDSTINRILYFIAGTKVHQINTIKPKRRFEKMEDIFPMAKSG